MKLVGAKGVDSPRVRSKTEQTTQIRNFEKLAPAESASYRSLVVTLAYVAQDRVDIADAVKCVTRRMIKLFMYPRQTSGVSLLVHMDSDWAGGLVGRRARRL